MVSGYDKLSVNYKKVCVSTYVCLSRYNIYAPQIIQSGSIYWSHKYVEPHKGYHNVEDF